MAWKCLGFRPIFRSYWPFESCGFHFVLSLSSNEKRNSTFLHRSNLFTTPEDGSSSPLGERTKSQIGSPLTEFLQFGKGIGRQSCFQLFHTRSDLGSDIGTNRVNIFIITSMNSSCGGLCFEGSASPNLLIVLLQVVADEVEECVLGSHINF